MADSQERQIEIQETQTSRENQLIKLVAAICPEVVLRSRKREGFSGLLSRLRFDRKIKLKWFLEMFSQVEPLAFIISKTNNSALNLFDGWVDVEIRVYDFLFLEKAGKIVQEYQKFSGKKAIIIFEPIETKSVWQPVTHWILAIFTIILLLLGSRLLSAMILRRAFQDLMRFLTNTFV